MNAPCSLGVRRDRILRRERVNGFDRFHVSTKQDHPRAPSLGESTGGVGIEGWTGEPDDEQRPAEIGKFLDETHVSSEELMRPSRPPGTLTGRRQIASRCADQISRELLQGGHVGPFEHDAQLRLGPAPANEQPTFRAELLLGVGHALPELAHLFDGAAARERRTLEDLGHAFHYAGELRERLLLAHHDREHLERRDDPVTRRGVIRKNQMTGLLSAERIAVRAHFFHDVPIADGGAHELPAGPAHGQVEPHVAHDGGHERVLVEASLGEHARRAQRHDGVAVDDDVAVLVDDDLRDTASPSSAMPMVGLGALRTSLTTWSG